jgi:hypothetical protein
MSYIEAFAKLATTFCSRRLEEKTHLSSPIAGADTMRKSQVVYGQKDKKIAHHKNGTFGVSLAFTSYETGGVR